MREHVLCIHVRNRPGVMTRIAGMFYRRGYNMESVTVGKTHEPGISKIVIAVPGELEEVELLRRQMHNMVDVRDAVLLERGKATFVEVCLLRVACDTHATSVAVMAAAQPYDPKLLGFDHDAITLRVSADPYRLDDFVAAMGAFTILDISRTGMTALGPPQDPVPHERGARFAVPGDTPAP